MHISHITPGNSCKHTSTITWQNWFSGVHVLYLKPTFRPNKHKRQLSQLMNHINKRLKEHRKIQQMCESNLIMILIILF